MTGQMVGSLMPSERERDEQARQLPCSVCGAEPRRPCLNLDVPSNFGNKYTKTVHTARYLDAVVKRLVPPLPGWPWWEAA